MTVRVNGRSERRISTLDRMTGGTAGLLRRIIALAALAVFVLFPLRFGVSSFAGSVQRVLAGPAGVGGEYGELLTMLDQEIPPHSVIVSDPRTSYFVSAYTDHYIVVTLDQHCSPADKAAIERMRAVRDLFSPAVPLANAMNWLRDEGAGFILVNTRLFESPDFFGTVAPDALALTTAKFRSCPGVLREVPAPDGFLVFEVLEPDSGAVGGTACTERFARPLPCRKGLDVVERLLPGESRELPEMVTQAPVRAEEPAVDDREGIGRLHGMPRDTAFDTGVDLAGMHLTQSVYAAGDTITGWLCWRVARDVPYGLPLEWTIRLDTDYPRGALFRPWYSKLYRRGIERRNHTRYRLTRTYRLKSGFTHPDQWDVGRTVRQDFSLVVPREMASGGYRVKIAVRRAAYLPNRTMRDYFTNDDSLDGVVAADITIILPHARTPSAARVGRQQDGRDR
jgi:hypothetical protein